MTKDNFNSLIIAFSVVLASFVLAFGFKNISYRERTVTVRGLSEREVNADLAIWPLTFQLGNNNLQTLQKEITNSTDKIVLYLKEKGLSESDFTIQAPSITDNSLNPYLNNREQTYTYIAKTVVLVRSSKILNVKNAQACSLELLSDGINVVQEYGTNVKYDFTALNEIKPQMIAEATENARKAAEQFAIDSNSKVGKIKTATQGLFTIENASVGLEEKKSVRVVTTITYLLSN